MNSLRSWKREQFFPQKVNAGQTDLRLYRLSEVAHLTGLGLRKIKSLIREGHLKGTKIPGSVMRVAAADLREFLSQHKTRTIL